MKAYTLSTDGLNSLINDLTRAQKGLERKREELIRRLAEIGAENARIDFATAPYDGLKDCTVRVEHRGENQYAVIAEGETVLFIEFGAGYTYGFGHPEAAANGLGPGTYPGQTHADDPNGWYLPAEARMASGKKKSYGNPPSMPMYNAVKYLEQHLQQIAQEVLSGD